MKDLFFLSFILDYPFLNCYIVYFVYSDSYVTCKSLQVWAVFCPSLQNPSLCVQDWGWRDAAAAGHPLPAGAGGGGAVRARRRHEPPRRARRAPALGRARLRPGGGRQCEYTNTLHIPPPTCPHIHCTALHFTALHWTALYYTTLHPSHWPLQIDRL